MPIYKGSQNFGAVYKGSTKIGLVYKGSNLLYQLVRQKTFGVSDSLQTFIVPNWCKKLHIDCVASRGYNVSTAARGGYGGRVECDLAVTPGQILYIMVGNIPANNGVVYNASDIRTNNAGVTNTTSLQSRLIVAGGGGSGGGCNSSQGQPFDAVGGAGGGLTGGSGIDRNTQAGIGGKGGSQSAGGAAGYFSMYLKTLYAKNGTFGLGGAAASEGGYSGAGGAGWYGGGGGVDGYYYAGSNERGSSGSSAGGGSSYTHPSLCTNVKHTQGYRNGAGYVIISLIA